jgi:glycosyltransferase involved in cell wall biosynthesis
MWSLQKGCDILAEACQLLKIKLLHVGSVGDYPLPQSKYFTHINSVDQPLLINYYKQAKIFVLPSMQEGLALVQAQAIACGLPVVCSKDTGGRDLAQFLDDKKWIIEMQETTVNCLVKCINQALLLANEQPMGLRNYSGEAITKLTWETYGKRYEFFLQSIL